MAPTPSEIAHRSARRLALVLEYAAETRPLDSGLAACDQPGSWADYAAGLGLDGPVADADLDELVTFYEALGRIPRIQTTPYQHPSLFDGLAKRGFVLYDRSTVLVHALDDLPANPLPDGLAFRAVNPSDPVDVQAFVDAQERGFFDDDPAPAGLKAITARIVPEPRVRFWLLEAQGAVVGSGGLESFESSTALIAGSVYRQARRRGLHLAFMRFRLEQVRAAGRGYAMVASDPGGPTERNALRCGFRVAYTQLGFERRPTEP